MLHTIVVHMSQNEHRLHPPKTACDPSATVLLCLSLTVLMLIGCRAEDPVRGEGASPAYAELVQLHLIDRFEEEPHLEVRLDGQPIFEGGVENTSPEWGSIVGLPYVPEGSHRFWARYADEVLVDTSLALSAGDTLIFVLERRRAADPIVVHVLRHSAPIYG